MPRRNYSIAERLAAIEEAIFAMDPAKFDARIVREAFDCSDSGELAFQLIQRIERAYDLELMIQFEPAKSSLDWIRIRERADDAYKLKLHDRAVLGPAFPARTLAEGERILKWIEAAGDGAAWDQAKVDARVADLLCYLADRHYGLSNRIRKYLPSAVFSERLHRPDYEARKREQLGLFAVAL
jgi:hypothetical protein